MAPSGIRRFFDMLAEMRDVISLTIGEPDYHDAGADHPGRHRQPRGRRHALHRQWRDDRAAELIAATSSALRGRYDARAELIITVGASEAVDATLRAVCNRRRRGHLSRALLRRLRAVHPAGRRRSDRRGDDRRDGLPGDRGADRGGSHATHQGTLPRVSRTTRPGRSWTAASSRRSRAVADGTTSSSSPTRSTTGWSTANIGTPPSRRSPGCASGPCSSAASEVLRDDRLADRLRGRAGGAHDGHRQGPPVRDHVRAHRGPARGRRGAGHRRAPSCARCARSTTAAAADDAPLQRDRAYLRRTSGSLLLLPQREQRHRPADEDFAQQLLAEEHVAVVPGSAFGPSGAGHVRACYATAYDEIVEAMRRVERFVERRRTA